MHQDKYFIEADELIAKFSNPHLRIFDATIIFAMGMSPEEAAKLPSAHQTYLNGHIPGAAFFDHRKFSDLENKYEYMLAKDDILAEQIGLSGISNESEVIVYTTGILVCATRAWWLLRYAGVENVRVLNGGFAAWLKAGGAAETEERAYPPAVFHPKFSPEMFVSIDAVQAAIGSADTVIENALNLEWHNKEHIPGSHCLPLTDLMVGWETLLPFDQLKPKLSTADPDQRIINYCGGGIAATLNAMAHLMAGHENVAVYDGSLFEWQGEGNPLEKDL